MKKQIAKLGKGTLVYGVGQVLTKLIHFLLLPLFTAYLSPDDYGIISILAVFSFLSGPIFGLGLTNSIGIVYFGREGTNQRQSTIWTSFIILVISSVFFLVISFWFSGLISQLAFQTEEYGNFIRIVAVGTVFNGIINQPFVYRLQFEQRSRRFVLVSFISTALTVGITVWFVVFLRQGVDGFVRATLIGNGITFLIFFFSVVGWTKVSTSKATAYQLLRLGYPMIPSIIFVFIIQNSGRYMLQLYFGSGEVGVYAIGSNFGMAMNVAVVAFTTAWFPHFNSFINKQEEARLFFGKAFLYYTLCLGGLCLLFFIFSRPLVGLMTQSSFYEAHSVVGLIALGNFLVGTYSILSAGVYFAKKVYLVNFVQIGAALSSLVFNYLLIPVMGMIGAAISFLIANLIMTLTQYLINRKLKLLMVEYDGPRIWYFVLTAILVMTLSFIPRDYSMQLELLASMVVFVCLFLVLYAQLKSSERLAISALLRSVIEKFRRS